MAWVPGRRAHQELCPAPICAEVLIASSEQPGTPRPGDREVPGPGEGKTGACRPWGCAGSSLRPPEEQCALTPGWAVAEGRGLRLIICILCLHQLQWGTAEQVTHSCLETQRTYPSQRGGRRGLTRFPRGSPCSRLGGHHGHHPVQPRMLLL